MAQLIQPFQHGDVTVSAGISPVDGKRRAFVAVGDSTLTFSERDEFLQFADECSHIAALWPAVPGGETDR